MISSKLTTVYLLAILFITLSKAISVDKIFLVEDQDFSHLVVNDDTGDVIIGGKNIVFQLDPDLNVKHEVITGPHLDNSECMADSNGETCLTFDGSTVQKELTDNYNQIILIDYQNMQTITCGTLFQGQCYIHNSDNLSHFEVTARTAAHHIASNKVDLQNVAFIAHGIVQDGSTKTISNVMYIGTSQKLDDHISWHFFIASRNLNDFSLSYGRLADDPSIIDVVANPRNRKLAFVSHLTIGGFSYLFMNDETNGVETHSKIARICHNSLDLSKSYVDMYISCENNDKIYSQMTSVVQINDGNILCSFVDPDTSSSALCVFSMSDISAKFTWNLQSCYNGTIKREGLFDVEECQKFNTYTPEGIEHLVDYCGEDAFFEEYLVPRSSPPTTKPTSQPIFGSESQFTGLATMKVNGQHIVFVGSASGDIIKVHITSDLRRAKEISSTKMLDGPIKQDMVITQHPKNTDETFLYVMSATEIKKLRVEECEQYTTCDSCTGAKDPHCGWCSLEASCTTKAECLGEQQYDDIWLDFQQMECVALISVIPTQVPVNRDTQITLTLQRLPELASDDNYKCVFSNPFVTARSPIDIVSTQGSSTTARCTVPSSFKPDMDDAENVVFRLDIISTREGVPFLHQEGLILYDCAVQDTCAECVTSEFGCKWCVHDNHCRPQVAACEHAGSAVVNNGNNEVCPLVEPHSNTIYISVGVPSTITIPGQNLPSPMNGQVGYQCILNITGTLKTVPAASSNSKIVCQETPYGFNLRIPETKVSIQVTFDDYPVNSKMDISIWLYKCDVLAIDCSTCISLDEAKYQCAYCDRNIDTCAARDLCKQTVGQCPQGHITSISPISGPIEGGTWITIVGTELSSINLDIDVAGRTCANIIQKPSTQVLCQTRAVVNSKVGKVVITKGLGDSKETVESADLFAYKNPIVISVTPTYGPKSGGTIVEIVGQQLDVDVAIEIHISSQSTCNIHNITHDRIICLTDTLPPEYVVGDEIEAGRITFDTATRSFGNKFFHYRHDPIINDVFPTSFYESGGRVITISGTNLDVVQHPQIIFAYEGTKYYNPCNITRLTQLKCRSPNLKITTNRRKRQINEQYDPVLGLLMDGVLSVRDLSNVTGPVLVYRDPILKKFGDTPKSYRPPEPLVIEGTNLNKAVSKDEIKMKIDEEDCVIYQLTEENILCYPHVERPQKDKNEYAVEVIIGNLQFDLGYIEYDTEKTPDIISDNMLVIKIGSSIAGVVLILVTILIVVVCTQKRRTSLQREQSSYFDNAVSQFELNQDLEHSEKRDINGLASQRGHYGEIDHSQQREYLASQHGHYQDLNPNQNIGLQHAQYQEIEHNTDYVDPYQDLQHNQNANYASLQSAQYQDIDQTKDYSEPWQDRGHIEERNDASLPHEHYHDGTYQEIPG